MSEPTPIGNVLIRTVSDLLDAFNAEGSYSFTALTEAGRVWVSCKSGHTPVLDIVTHPNVSFWTVPATSGNVDGDPFRKVQGVGLLPGENAIEVICEDQEPQRFEGVSLVMPATF